MDKADSRILHRHFYQCYRPGHCLGVLKRGCRFSFFGVFDVQVLYGKVVSRGYEFEAGAYADERFISVAAPYALGPPIQFISFPNDSLHAFSPHRVKWRLKELTNAVNTIMEGLEDGDSIILLRFTVSKMCACVRELYGETFFVPPDSTDYCSVGRQCSLLQCNYPLLYEGRTADNIVELVKLISARSGEGKRSITMIVGNKSVGKSVLTRLVANSLLGKDRPSVYVLDCDVGQAEMNPSGCLSLLKINSPLLSVPMFQQRTFLPDTYFYGRILLQNDTGSYLVLLRKLLQRFENDSDLSSPLLINTLGWVEDKGASVLDEMLKLFDPDFIFSFVTPTGPNYRVPDSGASNCKKPVMFYGDAFRRPMHTTSLSYAFSAATLRNLLITGYMAHSCPSPSVRSFVNAAPYAVPFREIAIHLRFLEPFPPNHVFAVLNCTLVALCARDPATATTNERKLFDDEEMPVLLDSDEVPLRVLGFGFVRAVDLERHIFYVVTPLELATVQEVNVFARGTNIDLPQYFLVSQSVPTVPYVVRNQSTSFHSELFKELKVKSRRRKYVMMKRPMSHLVVPSKKLFLDK